MPLPSLDLPRPRESARDAVPNTSAIAHHIARDVITLCGAGGRPSIIHQPFHILHRLLKPPKQQLVSAAPVFRRATQSIIRVCIHRLGLMMSVNHTSQSHAADALRPLGSEACRRAPAARTNDSNPRPPSFSAATRPVQRLDTISLIGRSHGSAFNPANHSQLPAEGSNPQN